MSKEEKDRSAQSKLQYAEIHLTHSCLIINVRCKVEMRGDVLTRDGNKECNEGG